MDAGEPKLLRLLRMTVNSLKASSRSTSSTSAVLVSGLFRVSIIGVGDRRGRPKSLFQGVQLQKQQVAFPPRPQSAGRFPQQGGDGPTARERLHRLAAGRLSWTSLKSAWDL